MKVTGGGKYTFLTAIRLYKMGVPPKETLDMAGSPYPTIGYLLRSECDNLESKSHSWMVNPKGLAMLYIKIPKNCLP